MIEVAETDHYKLVVEFVACESCGQFHTNVVAGEAMHGTPLCCLLEEHFRLCADVPLIERACLPV